MKILIVDDEPRHRRGMKNIILSLRPDDCVIDAGDGNVALAMLREERPDVVFTDIRMPGLDGLELLGMLEQEIVKPVIVMVSAYDRFDYAQLAMRRGAYDYLLKPVEVHKVADLLERIELLLQEERERQSESEALKLQLRVAASGYRKRLLISWINGASLTDEEQKEVMALEWLHSSGLVIYSEFHPDHPDAGHREHSDPTALLFDMERICGTYGMVCTLPLESLFGGSGQWVSLVQLHPQYPQSLEKGLEDLLLELLALSKTWSKAGRLWHSVDKAPKSLWEEGVQALRQARDASVYHFYERHGGALMAGNIHPSSNQGESLDSRILWEALQAREPDLAVDLCLRSFEQLAVNGRTRPLSVKEHAVLLLMKIKSRNLEHVERQVGDALMQAAASGIPACRTFRELLVLMEHIITQLHQALHASKDERDKELAAECVKWIMDNRKQAITLEMTAEHFHFNSSYFSTWIKNHTSKTFTEHLLDARMTRAAELLDDNRLKIYEVAAECGYTDTKYFCRVFKKRFGLSPERHRQMSFLRTRGES